METVPCAGYADASRSRRRPLDDQQERTVDVCIDGYTVKVDNRRHNLGHLVSTRVDVFPIGFVGGPLAAVWARKWWLGISLLVSVSANISLGVRLAAIGILLGTIGNIVTMLQGRAIGYRLTLETAFGAEILESRDPDALYDLEERIGAAINNPPKTIEQYVIHGDLIQQTGEGNVAIQVR
jgi:hypothetical protein